MTMERKEESDNKQNDKEEKEDSEEEIEKAEISMHNAKDRNNSDSIQFKEEIDGTTICTLLDSGSTHTFVYPELLRENDKGIVKIKVANGEKMVTDLKYEGLKFKLQGVKFKKDVRLLAIDNYDVILDLYWFKGLKLAHFDFDKNTLEFQRDGKGMILQIQEEVTKVKLMQEGITLDKEFQKGKNVIVARLFHIQVVKDKELVVNPEFQSILEGFSDVFQEPQGLPPNRNVDHRIPLVIGSKQVNQRPCRYSYFQKLEIERIVEELMKQSFIQESHSPYASPILLVKKKD